MTPAMIVAVTIRADRYEPLQIAPQLAGVHTRGVRRTQTDAARRVHRGHHRPGPARHRRRAAADASNRRWWSGCWPRPPKGADALPLLALTLERLYRDFGADGDLTVAEYESMGGMAQVVQTEVDSLLAADPEQRQAQLDILHDAFIPWLATINPDNDQPMRRLARWDDLPAASHPLIQAMVEKRLLVKDTRDGQTVVEVALESLLRQWRELAAWLRDEAQDLKDADSLERAAADWQRQRPQRLLAAGRHPAGRRRNPGRQTRFPRPPRPHPRLPARLPAARRRPHRGREATPASRTPSRQEARGRAAETLPHSRSQCWRSPPSSPSWP